MNLLRPFKQTYGLYKTGSESKVIVYDLGKGTLNVFLLSIKDSISEVLAMARDTHLGEDFDYRVIYYLLNAYDKKPVGFLE